MSAEQHPRSSKLFFALIPDRATAQVLHTLAVSRAPSRARIVPSENVHLTLLFLGPTEPEQERCLLKMAESIKGSPISLLLERLGSWRRAQVMWSAPDTMPLPLLNLVSRLEQGVEACGLARETRPYRPHITLARRVRRRLQTGSHPPINWQAKAFQLLASVPVDGGVRYESRGLWPLEASALGASG